MSFPTSIGSYREYSIVKMNVIPNYTALPYEFNDYVFVFGTYRNSKDPMDGVIEVEIVPENSLNLFNAHVLEATKFIYEGGTLKVHDQLEIIEEKSEFQTKYIAVLKEQPIRSKDSNEICMIKDKYILLCFDNKGIKNKYIDNLPVADYAPEFQAFIEYKRFKETYERFKTTKNVLQGVEMRTKNQEEKEHLAKTLSLLEKEVTEKDKKYQEGYRKYMNLRST